MKKTNRKMMGVMILTGLASATSVFADLSSPPVYVNSLIKCHEAKFDFDDSVGQLNGHFMQTEVGALAGYVNTGKPGEINPQAQPVAIKAPFTASAPVFITDTHGVLWACVTLNSK